MRKRLFWTARQTWIRAAAVCLCALLLTACGGRSAPSAGTAAGAAAAEAAEPAEEAASSGRPDWHRYLGEEDYLGRLVALTLETDSDGVLGIRHRRVARFEDLIANAGVPVVLCFYDQLADHAHRLIPDVEQLAEAYEHRACFLLITPDAHEGLFSLMERDQLPVVYWVERGAIAGSAKGWTAETVSALRRAIEGAGS